MGRHSIKRGHKLSRGASPGLKGLALSVFRRMPRDFQFYTVKGYVAYKKNRLKRLSTPTSLIFYVTNKCNLKCRHCFFWQDINAPLEELRLDEIERIAVSLRHPVCLSLTGGEPFLRPDIGQICLLFARINNTQEIGIPTNGFLTGEIIDTCRFVLADSALRCLQIQVSLDGLEETHDAVRGVTGAFSRAISTIRALKALKKDFSRLEINIAYTVQRDNINEVEGFIRHMLPFRVPLRFNIIRGGDFGTYGVSQGAESHVTPREKDSASIPVDLLERTFQKIGELNDKADFKFWPPTQRDAVALSLAMLKEKKKQIPCYAGVIDSVLYSNGDVAMCELTRPFANIRDFNYDFARLWNSADAARMRKLICNCFCIHGCNLTTSLTFRPETVLKRLTQDM